jgi:hypothetical protein
VRKDSKLKKLRARETKASLYGMAGGGRCNIKLNRREEMARVKNEGGK